MRELAGFFSRNYYIPSSKIIEGNMHAMVTQINHRGPDGQGEWPDSREVLGHAHLPIIDASNGCF